jgi:hypothetical protein
MAAATSFPSRKVGEEYWNSGLEGRLVPVATSIQLEGKEESYTCDPSKCGVEGSPGALGHEPYGERHVDCTNYVNHLLSN